MLKLLEHIRNKDMVGQIKEYIKTTDIKLLTSSWFSVYHMGAGRLGTLSNNGRCSFLAQNRNCNKATSH